MQQLMYSERALLSSAREHPFAVRCLVYTCSSSRCSHAGIVNVVTDAVNVFKRPVHMVRWDLIVCSP